MASESVRSVSSASGYMLFKLILVLVHGSFRFDLYFMHLQVWRLLASRCATISLGLIHERGQSTSGASNTICFVGTTSASVYGTLAFVTIVNAWKYLQVLDYI